MIKTRVSLFKFYLFIIPQFVISQTTDTSVNSVLNTSMYSDEESQNYSKVLSDKDIGYTNVNFSNTLYGQLLGADVNTGSGGFGTASRIFVRGHKSLYGDNNVVYVIDGIPFYNINNGYTDGIFSAQPRGEGISDFNYADIESITLISPGYATALYGLNGANGVISIKTKKPEFNKFRINIENHTLFSTKNLLPEFQSVYGNNPGEFKNWGQEIGNNNYKPEQYFHTGLTTNTNVSLNYGTKINSLYFLAATTKADGILNDNSYNRNNISLKNRTNLFNNRLLIDLNISYTNQKDENIKI